MPRGRRRLLVALEAQCLRFGRWVGEARPVLVVFDDGADDPVIREDRGRLQGAAAEHGVRVETVATEAGTEVARYASLVLNGRYGAEYLRLGLVED